MSSSKLPKSLIIASVNHKIEQSGISLDNYRLILQLKLLSMFVVCGRIAIHQYSPGILTNILVLFPGEGESQGPGAGQQVL